MITINGTLRVKRIRNGRHGAFCVADLLCEEGEFKVKDPLLDQFDEGEYQGRFWVSEIYLAQYVMYGKGVTEIRVRLHDLQVDREEQGTLPREPSDVDPLDERPSPRIGPPATSSGSSKAARGGESSPADAPSSARQALANLKSNALGKKAGKQHSVETERATGASVAPTLPEPLATPMDRTQVKPAPVHAAVTEDRESVSSESVEGSLILDSEAHACLLAREPVKLDPTVDRALLRQQGDLLRNHGYKFDAKLQTWMPRQN